jgi:hypothetical protein
MMNFNNYLSGYSENVVEIIENFQLEKPIEKLTWIKDTSYFTITL